MSHLCSRSHLPSPPAPKDDGSPPPRGEPLPSDTPLGVRTCHTGSSGRPKTGKKFHCLPPWPTVKLTE